MNFLFYETETQRYLHPGFDKKATLYLAPFPLPLSDPWPCFLPEIRAINYTETIIDRKELLALFPQEVLPPFTEKSMPDFATWEKQINTLKLSLLPHEKTVLARMVHRVYKKKLSPLSLVAHLLDSNAKGVIFMIDLGNSNYFIGITPEKLFSIQEGILSTDALAATLPKTRLDQFENWKKDRKEQTEQALVFAWLEETLSCYGTLLKKDESIYDTGYALHRKTELTFSLFNPQIDPIFLAKKLSPTPALGGFPREKALSHISSFEPFSRGLYGGSFGILQQERSDFYVGIRSALVKGENLYLFAGCGILYNSDPQKEWEETVCKLSLWP